MNCVFCRIAAGETSPFEILLESPEAWVMLHDDWAVRGHAMVVARRHVENLSDLASAEAERFARVWHQAERVLLEVTGADRAIALKLGILTPHLHVHLYPVRASLDRAAVWDIIEAKTRDASTPEQRARFVADLRKRVQGEE
jgi:diadenosine tetraphosphate (Ap4A) HIT family hydrolase